MHFSFIRRCVLYIADSLLSALHHYELAVPVRVDRHGTVLRPPAPPTTTTKPERRSRRSSDVSTIMSPPADDDNELDVPASTAGNYLRQRGYAFIRVCLFVYLQDYANYSIDFHKIRWKASTWTTQETIRFLFMFCDIICLLKDNVIR